MSAEESKASPTETMSEHAGQEALGTATYEVIRQRLRQQAEALRGEMGLLDARRRKVFGSIESKLLQADRIVTSHNCIPCDMVQLGHGRFLFGFNVKFGLKKEVELGDVFAIYDLDEEAGSWKEGPLELLQQQNFVSDFRRLYNVYSKATLSKFSVLHGNLFMVFQVGNAVTDIAVFKWAFQDGGLKYLDGRAETEFKAGAFPPRHEFAWRTPDRESYRHGDHPHISIEDRVFVECVGGDLTIKVEDNTESGEGIHAEPVEDRHQKVDDAEVAYALVDHLVLLKIRPYKEKAYRYFIFNEKLHEAVRVDSIGDSCALLPEGHGLIFPDGYCLGSGELKRFDNRLPGLILERVLQAPNGEDSLYVFYHQETGHYALMAYRLIEQKVEERITCNGFSIFPNGHLVLFRAEDDPQRHHMIQVRQTPFHAAGHEPAGNRSAFLYQVGNKDVVRCLAECNEVLSLALRENPYPELYDDLVRRISSLLDAYPWLNSEDGFGLPGVLGLLREAGSQAVEEFDKVRRLRLEAARKLKELGARCDRLFEDIRRARLTDLQAFVRNLSALRHLRGDLITFKEVRYADLPAIDQLEAAVLEQTSTLSRACVQFLLKPEALDPYKKRAEGLMAEVDAVAKASEGRRIEKEVAEAGGELEMLIEIVNGLQIEDATETTRIIDSITSVYAILNQVKAAVKKRLHQLVATESAARFSAQMKLLGQSAASYLDLCDSPAKCDDYLNRLSVQLEEMEGAFADFEEYTLQITERRAELYEAFEQRKVALVEQRNRRAAAILTAAERILKVIGNRLAGFDTLEEIHTYMASDLMISKVRDSIQQLMDLEDSVKADDLQGRLKALQQEAVRQLRDRQDLFSGGKGLIQLGRHQFNINTQPLDLTVVRRDEGQFLHLTGTRYFDPIQDEAFLATREVWDQALVSENDQVYRAEYLAWTLLRSIESTNSGPSVAEVAAMGTEALAGLVRDYMGTRYQEGYTKGVHDADAVLILKSLASARHALGLARYRPDARACAMAYWTRFIPEETLNLWTAKLHGFHARNQLFAGDPMQRDYVRGLACLIEAFCRETGLHDPALHAEAGEYLFHQIQEGAVFSVSQEGGRLAMEFRQHLSRKGSEAAFEKAREALAGHPASELELIRDWVGGFLLDQPEARRYRLEVSAMIFCSPSLECRPVEVASSAELEGMKGSHPLLEGPRYRFDYLDLVSRLTTFEGEQVPRYHAFQEMKARRVESEREKLRLKAFEPRVLSSFVRNQLIDEVYLPMVGDNLAKQIGAAGQSKRTDLMGLLLLISPPGYGKTTLMEYVANRLGIIFVKVNGPAIGHHVTSLDPAEAPNASAREEIEKLNLSLEMGDNVLICLDDIQHCNPELLQKFISLCDAQRKIEGVWRGRPRTYDLRGRKVVVVMAGNPYTESGQKFQIPDMLANRADTYNLGDIIGGNPAWFKASYIENAITSNPVLAPLANRSQKDVRAFIRMAETGDRTVDLEGGYSPQETEEILAVMGRLLTIREVILKVNQEYIRSAAQADEFRTEPPFKLQGSYRNMNRLAEKVASIMNEQEVMDLVIDHYRNESQTLTAGTEANLLKFKELIGQLTTEEEERWEEIRRTFRRNQITRGADDSDPLGRLSAQLTGFQAGLEGIQVVIEKFAKQSAEQVRSGPDLSPVERALGELRESLGGKLDTLFKQSAPDPLLGALTGIRDGIVSAMGDAKASAERTQLEAMAARMAMVHETLRSLQSLASEHARKLKASSETLTSLDRQGTIDIHVTQEMLQNEQLFLQKFHELIAARSNRSSQAPSDGNQTS